MSEPTGYYAAMLAVEPNSWAAVELWRAEGRRRADRGMIGVYCCPEARFIERDDGSKVIQCRAKCSVVVTTEDRLTALGLNSGLPILFHSPTSKDTAVINRIVRSGVVPAVAPER